MLINWGGFEAIARMWGPIARCLRWGLRKLVLDRDGILHPKQRLFYKLKYIANKDYLISNLVVIGWYLFYQAIENYFLAVSFAHKDHSKVVANTVPGAGPFSFVGCQYGSSWPAIKPTWRVSGSDSENHDLVLEARYNPIGCKFHMVIP